MLRVNGKLQDRAGFVYLDRLTPTSHTSNWPRSTSPKRSDLTRWCSTKFAAGEVSGTQWSRSAQSSDVSRPCQHAVLRLFEAWR